MKAVLKKPSSRPVLLISGSRGLAETFIHRFRQAGFEISCLVRDFKRAALLTEQGTFCAVGDLSSNSDINRWFESTLLHFGRVDCVINNAAIQGEVGRLHELELNAFAEVIQTNLIAPTVIAQLALRHFLERGSGVILNLSGGGATQARPRFSAYAASKCALVRLTETWALEYPEFNFYAISPGALKTAMTEGVVQAGPERAGKEFAEAKQRLVEGGEDPNRAADLALWLVQEKPKHLNGKLISAIWDDYLHTAETPEQIGWWNLRRIDEQCQKRLDQTKT